MRIRKPAIVIFVLAAECDGLGILAPPIGFEQDLWRYQGADLKFERA
jgi:hypothetical protein